VSDASAVTGRASRAIWTSAANAAWSFTASLGEDLAVHLDAGFLEALDEPVVGQPVQTRSRVDTGDPQASEVTLPGAPVAVGVDEGVGDLLLGLAVQPGSLPPVTGGALQGGAPFLLGVYSPFNACHRGDSLL